MDRSEREKWIEEHYADLVKEAAIRRYANPEDVVQQTVARLLESAAFGVGSMGAWPFAVSAMKSVAHTERRSEERFRGLRQEERRRHTSGNYRAAVAVSQDAGRTGEDVAYYPRQEMRLPAGASQVEPAFEMVGGPGGNGRWVYQQKRDARLFDASAVKSLSESIRGVSRRGRHEGRAGYSFVIFGQEVLR
jgi:hypothetical protein